MMRQMWRPCLGLLGVVCLLWGCGVEGMEELDQQRRGMAWERGTAPLQPKVVSLAPEHLMKPAVSPSFGTGTTQRCGKQVCFPVGPDGAERCFSSRLRHSFLRPTLQVEDLNGGDIHKGDRLRVTVKIEHVGQTPGSIGPRWSDAHVMFQLPKSWNGMDIKHVGTFTTSQDNQKPEPFNIGGAAVSGGMYQWTGQNLCLVGGHTLILQFEVTADTTVSAKDGSVSFQAFVFAHNEGVWTDNASTIWGPDGIDIKVKP